MEVEDETVEEDEVEEEKTTQIEDTSRMGLNGRIILVSPAIVAGLPNSRVHKRKLIACKLYPLSLKT